MKKDGFKRFALIVSTRGQGADLWDTSVLIAYYMLLSLVPLLIALGNIMPFFNINPIVVLDYVNVILPETVQRVLNPIILGLLTNSNSGMLSFGIVGLIWSASIGIGHIQKGMNKAYGVDENGNYVSKKLISLLTILLALGLMVGLVLVFGFSEIVLSFLSPFVPGASSLLQMITDLKWPVAITAVFCLLVLIYRITPDTKIRLRDTLPGACLSTGGLLLLLHVFGLYIRFVTRRFNAYDTLVAFFIMMFWLNFSVLILLAGAVLNASIAELRFGPAQKADSPVDSFIYKVGGKWLNAAKQKIGIEPPPENPPVPPEDDSKEQPEEPPPEAK